MELNKLYNMDCMEGLKQFPDNFFDLAIVDPPYGIGMDGGNRQYTKYERKTWDRKIPEKEYFEELERVSQNRIIWGGNYFGLPPTKGFVIWDKTLHGNTFADCEMAWTSFDKVARIYKCNICHIGKRIHPTQKPVALYKWILSNYAKQGDLILDTHVGSASSLIACYDMGFDYIGFEIDEGYYNAAQKRIAENKAQMRWRFGR